jgi:hypothetical protein
MSLDACLPDLERKGEIDVGRSKEARDLYAELRRYYERSHDPETAAALASQATIERLEAAVAHKKANTIRMIKAQQGVLAKARTYDGGDPAGTGPINPKGGEAVLAFDGRAGHNDSVHARQNAIKGRAHGMIADILAGFHRNVIGQVRNKAQLADVVRELFKPGSTGNADARELAESWMKAAEMLRSRFNEAGGQIGKVENWGLPQSHSSARVRKEGYEGWRNFIAPLLDRGRMIDRLTGEPMTDARLELVLREAFEKIRTDGWSSITPGSSSGVKMLANQHAAHRFLHFADGDAWLAYQQKFGSGTAFDAMMGHIEAMSRDIALMEILGPNPKATIRWLQDTIRKSAELDTSPGGKAIDRAKAGVPKIQRLYDEVTGALRRPESERLALGFGTVRSIETSAKLGAAILSALPTDPAFGAVTRRFNGLPAWKMFGGYLKHLNPLSDVDRRFAVRSGLIAEEWAKMTAAQHRILSEELTGNIASRLAEGTLRVTGLAAYTQAGRWAFGMEFLGHLTDQVGKRFGELDPKLARAMERHGIGADTWDIIRRSPLEVHKGVGWIMPAQIEDQLAGDRLLQMIQTETDYAVPVADLRTRAMMNSFAPKGTWIGELGRSALLFKTFGITLLMTHGRRMLEQSPGNLAKYAAAFFIMSTLGGAAAMELKSISKGQDPRPVPGRKDPLIKHAEFWGASALQGGGLGIWGDFLGSTENRFGGGPGETAAGPLVSSIANFGGAGFSAVRAGLGDKKAHPGRDLVKAFRQEAPGNSIWWGRVAFNRLVADQLQEQLDPDYRKSWRAMQRRAKQQGQDFWWEPGETSPKRAPKVGNSLGGHR